MRLVALAAFFALVALSACNTVTKTLSHKLVTLGYPETPSIALVTRPTDSVAVWAASLRARGSATIVAELTAFSGDTKEVCDAVRAASPDQRIDEILVLDTTVASYATEPCIAESCTERPFLAKNDNPPTCVCLRQRYEKVTTTLSASVVAIRASSCQVVATYDLPSAKADSTPRAPIEFGVRTEDVIAARSADETDSRRLVVVALAPIVATHPWRLFPREKPTVRAIDQHTFEVVDRNQRLEPRSSYLVKTPVKPPRPSARVARIDRTTLALETTGETRVARVDGTTATLETTGSTTLEPRDELHVIDDVRRIMVYGALAGGTLRADNGSNGTAAAALAGRVSFERLPIMFELRLEGDLIPGVESARWGVGGAGGFRYALGPIAPVVFAEAGGAVAYQTGGARAYGLITGLGVGAEVSIGRWTILADLRRRWFHMDEWKTKDGMSIDVKYPDLTWISTTVQLGIGNRF